jgi:hypothetical protein
VTEETSPEQRDASEVGSEVARAAWAEAARPVLLEAAGRYRALVTYKQLAAAVQEGSGITTTQPMHQWLGVVLERVTADSLSRGEPLLSSLCVTAQGSVGQGYADAIEHAGGERPADPDDHAANERLRCYQHWQAEGLPRDGGTPLRTAHFAPARKAPARTTTPRATTPRKTAAARPPATRKMTGRPTAAAEATPVRPIELCPRCFTQVPASGVCGYCD